MKKILMLIEVVLLTTVVKIWCLQCTKGKSIWWRVYKMKNTVHVFWNRAISVHDSWSNSKFIESITRLKQSHKFLLVKEFQLETWAVVWSTVRHNHINQSEAQGSLNFGTLVKSFQHFWRDFCVLCGDNICLKGDAGYY